MIRIRYSHVGDERNLTISGRAETGPRAKDIICDAGMSVIFQTMILGLHAIAKQYPDHVQIEE